MNKQIKIDKNTKIMFAFDIFVLVTIFVFRYVYLNIGYYYKLVNISLIMNIFVLVISLIYTYLLIISKIKYKYLSLIVFSVFCIYILFNTIGVILLNSPIEKQYKQTAQKIISYCEQYSCDTYETKYLKAKRKLIIQKTYFDYDNNENNIVFETLYDKDKIIKLTAYIDSSSDLYSEKIIKEELDGYFELYNSKVEEEYILKAFENRFSNAIKKDNMIYKVSEEYDKDNNLVKLKTIITLKVSD